MIRIINMKYIYIYVTIMMMTILHMYHVHMYPVVPKRIVPTINVTLSIIPITPPTLKDSIKTYSYHKQTLSLFYMKRRKQQKNHNL